MNNYYAIASIIFRLLNFGAVIALGVFWYRRSVRATMTELKDKKNQKQQDLEHQNSELLAHQHSLELHHKEQELESKRLLANIHAWRSAVERSLNAEMQERKALQDKVVIRVHKQEKEWELLALQQAVLGPTLKNTREQLLEKYSKKELGAVYVQKIVDELKHRV